MVTWKRLTLYFCFFTTGVFGLIYEVIWARYLTLLIGNSAHAHTIVLSTFMGGLSLGAFLFGRISDRLKNGFRVYGMIEGIIGSYAILFPTIFSLYEKILLPLGSSLEMGSASMTAFKLALSTCCILPPTILMGATLPVLTRYLTRSPVTLRRNVSALYALNCGGAVVGSLLAGFYLLFSFGMPGTMNLVGMLNMGLGLFVVLISRMYPDVDPNVEAPAQAATVSEGIQDRIRYSHSEQVAALALATFSGFGTMALEVAWIRFFSLLLGSSNYAFTLVLSAFISGIALGSIWFLSPKRSKTPLLPLMYAALMGTAIFIAISLIFYERMPFWLWKVCLLFRPMESVFGYYQFVVYVICFLLMLVPTMIAGIVFPATIRLASRQEAIGDKLGRIYAVNTIGTLLGAMITGLFLFRWIGVENVFRMVLISYALFAAVFAWFFFDRVKAIAVGGALALILVHLIGYTPIRGSALNMGLYRMTHGPDYNDMQFQKGLQADTILYNREGSHGLVMVRKGPKGRLFDEPLLSLTINGKADASTDLDMYNQVLLGQLPMLFSNNPNNVFIVGLGSGVTVGSVLTHGVRAEVAEISREVVEAAREFQDYNFRALENPNLKVFIEDARTVLRFSDRTYDAIISAPTNPWQSGVASLFSIEFYDLVKSKMKPGGIFTQWMHSYNTNDESLQIVTTTLLEAFKYVYIFEPSRGDYIYLASDRPIKLDEQKLEEKLATRAVHSDLARINADCLAVLLSTQIVSARNLRMGFQPERIHSDYFPYLEDEAQRGFFLHKKSKVYRKLDERSKGGQRLFLANYMKSRSFTNDELIRMVRFYKYHDEPEAKHLALAWAIKTSDNLSDPALITFYNGLLASTKYSLPVLAAERFFESDATETPNNIETLLTVAETLFMENNWSWAPYSSTGLEAMVNQLAEVSVDTTSHRLRMIGMFCRMGPFSACDRQIAFLEKQVEGASVVPSWFPFLFQGRFLAAMAHWDLEAARQNIDQLKKYGLGHLEMVSEMEIRLKKAISVMKVETAEDHSRSYN